MNKDQNLLLHTKAEVKSTDEEGVIQATVASTNVLDRAGDIIDQNGWDLNNFKKNPVVLWGHNVREERPPIGKALKVWVEGEGKKAKLMFKTQFDMADEFAADIYRKVKEGFINMVSVGFLPTEWERIDKNDIFSGNRYLKSELLEISYVPVPANPQAAVQLRSMGTEPIEEDKLYEDQKENKNLMIEDEASEEEEQMVEKNEKELEKRALPYKAYEALPDSTEWDGPGEVSKSSIEDLKEMCAWVDSEKEGEKSAYKLPHHRQLDKKVVWRGVASAMAQLMGANGGLDIPEEDKKAVYNHLVKHYKQFEKEAPEYRHIEEQTLKSLEDEVTAVSLDREDKYAVRLIKQLLTLQKKSDKKQDISTEQVVKALSIVDKSLTTALGKGGE